MFYKIFLKRYLIELSLDRQKYRFKGKSRKNGRLRGRRLRDFEFYRVRYMQEIPQSPHDGGFGGQGVRRFVAISQLLNRH